VPANAAEQAYAEFLGVGSDAGLPADIRFLSNVRRLVRKRARQSDASAIRRQAVFVLAPEPPAQFLAETPRLTPRLDNGATDIDGRVWFTSEAVNLARSVALAEDVDDATLFTVIGEHEELGVLPTVLFDVDDESPTLRYYPKGLANPAQVTVEPAHQTPLTLANILECIDRIYSTSLKTPGALERGISLWQDPTRYIAASNAEAVIQFALKIGLSTRFLCAVRTEQPGVSGRLDIEFDEAVIEGGSVFDHVAVFELKVLREVDASGRHVGTRVTEDIVTDGLDQVVSYRAERSTRFGALLCFDMRATESGRACFQHVLELSRSNGIELRAWHIYTSAPRSRQGIAKAAQGPA
jgi:hypothetical protein